MPPPLTANEAAQHAVDAAMAVHKALGPGLLESAYVRVLAYELERRGVRVEREVPIGIRYEGLVIEDAFRADLIVEDVLIVEVKSTEGTHPVHKKQLLTYLRLADKRLGLLINFGMPLLRDGLHRIANGMPP